jgi:hypothetical protein
LSDAESWRHQRDRTALLLRRESARGGKAQGGDPHKGVNRRASATARPLQPSKRDVLGTVLLSVLSGHWRYAHITALRGDGVNAPLLGMRKVVSEDAVCRALGKIAEDAGVAWLRGGIEETSVSFEARSVSCGPTA